MILNRQLRAAVLALLLSLVSSGSLAQIYHPRGGMGAGARFGLGNNGWDVGAMWGWQTWNKVGLLAEVDMEKADIDGMKTKNVSIGLGADFTAWQPLKWLCLFANGTLNVGYDKREIYDEDDYGCDDSFVYGAGLGLGAQAWLNSRLSIVAKWREWLLFSFDDNHMKPDYSLGLMFNWGKVRKNEDENEDVQE